MYIVLVYCSYISFQSLFFQFYVRIGLIATNKRQTNDTFFSRYKKQQKQHIIIYVHTLYGTEAAAAERRNHRAPRKKRTITKSKKEKRGQEMGARRRKLKQREGRAKQQ